MRNVRYLILAMIVAGVGLGFLGTLIPLPSNLPGEEAAATQFTLIFMLIMTVIVLGSVGLFLMGLRSFKTAFKHSYYYICTGLGLEALAILVLYTSIYISLYTQNEIIFAIGAIAQNAVYALAAGLVCIGLRYFALLLRMRTWTMSYKIVGVLVLVTAILAIVLPHPEAETTELLFDLRLALYAPYVLLAGIVTTATLHIRHTASSRYGRALLLFAIHWGLLFISGLTVIVSDLTKLIPDEVVAGFLGLYAISLIVLFFAGLSFNKISRQKTTDRKQGTPIDVLIYMAGLASNTKDIDPIMDGVRKVTARSNGTLTAADTAQLVQVYAQLEIYLVKDEPLRQFNRDELRNMLGERFDPQLISELAGSAQPLSAPSGRDDGTAIDAVAHTPERGV
jgi:hypothetical protein